MKEATETLLKKAGFGADVIKALKAEETPEDFNIEEIVKAHREKRKELILNDSELMKELKQKFNHEQYPAIAKPIIKALKDAGLSSEDIDGLKEEGHKYPDIKKGIVLLSERLQQSGSKTADEIRQELFDVKKQLEESKTSFTERLEKQEAGFKMQIKEGKLKSEFAKIVQKLDIFIPFEGANDMLYNRISNKLKIDISENEDFVILNKDGSKVASDNEFLTPFEIIKNQAEEYGIIKKSNGGGGDGGAGGNGAGDPPPNMKTTPGKLTGKAAEMARRIAEKNK